MSRKYTVNGLDVFVEESSKSILIPDSLLPKQTVVKEKVIYQPDTPVKATWKRSGDLLLEERHNLNQNIRFFVDTRKDTMDLIQSKSHTKYRNKIIKALVDLYDSLPENNPFRSYVDKEESKLKKDAEKAYKKYFKYAKKKGNLSDFEQYYQEDMESLATPKDRIMYYWYCFTLDNRVDLDLTRGAKGIKWYKKSYGK